MRYIAFGVLALVFLTGFTLKKTHDGARVVHFFTPSVTVHVEGDFPADRGLVEIALNVWTATCADMIHDLSQAPPTDLHNTIVVHWKETWADGDPAELAHTITFWNAHTGEILRAEIEVNGGRNFALHGKACTGEYDTATVIAHEFGHAFGLDHSGVEGALMAPTRATGVSQSKLSGDDRAGYCSLYPVQTVGETDETGGCTVMGSANLFAVLVSAIIALCRRRKRRQA